MKFRQSFILFLTASIIILAILLAFIFEHSNRKVSFEILLILFTLLLFQALYIFSDAKKRNEKYYWLWGLFGLLNFPSSLIIYLLVTRVILKKQEQNKLK